MADADEADDLFAEIKQRHLGRQRPVAEALGLEVGPFLVENRRFAGQHFAVVFDRLARPFGRVKIERRPAFGLVLAHDAERAKVRLVVDQVARLHILDEDAARQVVDDRSEQIMLFHEFLFGLFGGGDVPREPKGADDLSAFIPPGHLGGRAPGGAAVLAGDELDLSDDWLAGEDDLLLLGVRRGRMGTRKEIEVGLADGDFGRRHAQPFRMGPIDPNKSALAVLEIDPVGNRLHQQAQDRGIGGFGASGRRCGNERGLAHEQGEAGVVGRRGTLEGGDRDSRQEWPDSCAASTRRLPSLA